MVFKKRIPEEVKKEARALFLMVDKETGGHLYSNGQIAKILKKKFPDEPVHTSTIQRWSQEKHRGITWKQIFGVSKESGRVDAKLEIIDQSKKESKSEKNPPAQITPVAIDIPEAMSDISELNKEIYTDAYKGYKKAIQYVLEHDFIYMKDAIEAIKVFKDILLENKDALKEGENKEVIEGVIQLLGEINKMRQQDAIDLQNQRAQEKVKEG